MKIEIIDPLINLSKTREIWEALEARSDSSFFLSWGWMENWLACTEKQDRPDLVVFFEDKRPYAAFFLGKRTLGARLFPHFTGSRKIATFGAYCGRYLIRRRGRFLNATGDPHLDRIHIEYNGFLSARRDPALWAELINHLPGDWEELHLPGIEAAILEDRWFLNNLPFSLVIDHDTLSPFVDLDMIRACGGDYLSLLSRNTRGQINKAYRLWEEAGPVELEAAGNLEQGLAIFDELVSLHEATWRKRARGGAFSSPYLYGFHRRLIEKRFPHEEIQLLRILVAGKTVGCLYNFLYREKVYFYQSGFNYPGEGKLKPGLLAHVEAIRYNLARGNKTYDFLGGAERYKISLATGQNRLVWVRLQKPKVKFKIEAALKRAGRLGVIKACRGLLSKRGR